MWVINLIIIYIIISILLAIIAAFISSTIILNNPFKKNYSCSLFFEPFNSLTFCSNTPLIEILYKLYINYIFNICYYRVALPGKYFKFYSFKAFKVVFIMTVLGIFCFFILYFLNIFNFKKKIKFNQFLYKTYMLDSDKRKIVFLVDKWCCNPFNKIFPILKPYLLGLKDQQDTINSKEYIYINKIINSSIKQILEYNKNVEYINFYEVNHRIGTNNINYKHYFTEEISTRSDTNMSIMTNFNSALKQNFFNNNVDIVRFAGFRKESTLLSFKHCSGNVYANEPIPLNINNICYGLWKNKNSELVKSLIREDRYNIKNISHKIITKANKYDDTFIQYSNYLGGFDIPKVIVVESFNELVDSIKDVQNYL
jgi:hypothetical protein